MAGRIRGALPPNSSVRTQIVRVKGTEMQTFTILSTAIFGQDIHWYGNRSHQCTKEQGDCLGCNRAWPAKWKGYLHCVHWQSAEEPVFLELTKDAYIRLEKFAPERQSFRGLVVQVSKSKGGARGRYILNVLPREVPETELLPEEDPFPILRFLWNVKNSNGNHQNESI